jgi:hypothetical protein
MIDRTDNAWRGAAEVPQERVCVPAILGPATRRMRLLARGGVSCWCYRSE